MNYKNFVKLNQLVTEKHINTLVEKDVVGLTILKSLNSYVGTASKLNDFIDKLSFSKARAVIDEILNNPKTNDVKPEKLHQAKRVIDALEDIKPKLNTIVKNGENVFDELYNNRYVQNTLRKMYG